MRLWQFTHRAFLRVALSLAGACLVSVSAVAQVTPGAPASTLVPAPRLPAAELEKLVGPIALYPDDLLAILLPASTTPIEIVKAQRFLEKRRNNVKLQPDSSLPESVRNLLNYPDVVRKMSDDLDWTDDLGKAVASQQKDVIDAIQAFRRRVYAVGNLKTDDKQVIVVEKEVIKVVQADPQVIYVPQYQPTVVVVAQPAPIVAYYPTPYPVYYYPYPPGATFATGFFVGAATAYAFSWHSHVIHYGYDVHELQEERMEYARESREDWQAHQKEMQSQRQEQRQNQTQGQEGAREKQGQRPEAASGAQAQTQRQQAQPQQSAASSQAQRQQEGGTGQRSGQTWSPQKQSGHVASAQGTRLGDSQFSRGGVGGAFGVGGSSAGVASASQRGFESRFGGGGFGGRGGGGGRRR